MSVRNTPRTASGFALITALLFIVIVTLLAATMFRSSGTQGKIAGNTLERQRALEVAEGALRYGEWLLFQTALPAESATCNQVIDLNTPGALPVICLTPLKNPTTVPWSAGMRFTPNGMTVQAGGGLLPSQGPNTSQDVYYTAQPMLYIQKLGAATDGSMLYQITAAGYGGNAASVSVLTIVTSLQ